jgi:prepilin-type N-terminal cleavage/methylation domain-containing protein
LIPNRGFTLIEALVTAAVVACGLVAAASIFSFAIRANVSNRQMSAATALLYDKMEELKWAAAPIDGADIVTQDETYIRVWRVSATVPRSITVIVSAQSNPLTHRQTELIQAITLISPEF